MNKGKPENNLPDEEMSEAPVIAGDANADDVTSAAEPSKKMDAGPDDEFKAEIAALNDKYLRLAADFDNFRKRSAKESSERAERAVENFAVEILEVSDNIGRALKADESKLREGVEQIQKILTKILQNHSISPINSLNEKFDPELHEAIAYVPSDNEDGTVIDEVIRGYCMKDKVIRCARVAVSKGKKEE